MFSVAAVRADEVAKRTSVVASVNGTELTVADVLEITRQVPEQYKNLEECVLLNGIIERLVQQQLLASSIETPPSWLPTAMENQERNLLATSVIEAVRSEARGGVARQDAAAA